MQRKKVIQLHPKGERNLPVARRMVETRNNIPSLQERLFFFKNDNNAKLIELLLTLEKDCDDKTRKTIETACLLIHQSLLDQGQKSILDLEIKFQPTIVTAKQNYPFDRESIIGKILNRLSIEIICRREWDDYRERILCCSSAINTFWLHLSLFQLFYVKHMIN